MSPEAFQHVFEPHLRERIPRKPESLYRPVRDAIAAGGKRVRPYLTAIAAGGDPAEWLPTAVAVEFLHTFTLVHDDIMDNAATRRGHPTVYVAYGVNTAILAGDTIVSLAALALAEARGDIQAALSLEFARAFQAVCEGQALDKEFESRNDISLAEYTTMIELKTARMFELAAVLGAITAKQPVEPFRRFAREIGLAFQLQDDLLDLTGDETLGKTIGGDILEGKRTALFVLAMEQYQSLSHGNRSLMDRLRNRQTTREDIAGARQLFEELGILMNVADLAATHMRMAEEELRSIDPLRRNELLAFSDRLLKRSM